MMQHFIGLLDQTTGTHHQVEEDPHLEACQEEEDHLLEETQEEEEEDLHMDTLFLEGDKYHRSTVVNS